MIKVHYTCIWKCWKKAHYFEHHFVSLIYTAIKTNKRNQTKITKDRLDHFDCVVVNPGSPKYHRESKKISYKEGNYICSSYIWKRTDSHYRS
jgi:hypothetical protein